MTSVLVTGAGGYIGQRITRRLAADGMAVRAQVRRPVEWPPGVEQVVGDLVVDADLATSLADGVDSVIHLAGANEHAMQQDPAGAMADTVLVAERVAAAGAPRLMYLSTVHVYGTALTPGAVVTENSVAEPEHPYAEARLACEDVFRSGPAPALIFRLTNGVGAPARPEVNRWSLVANELCREGAISGRLTLRTSGAQWRDFIPLADVEAALSQLVRRPFQSGLYNLGSGSSVTVRGLAELIAQSFEDQGMARPPLVAPPLPEDPPGPYRIDISRLAQLEVGPATPLQDAVDETVRFCLAQREHLG